MAKTSKHASASKKPASGSSTSKARGASKAVKSAVKVAASKAATKPAVKKKAVAPAKPAAKAAGKGVGSKPLPAAAKPAPAPAAANGSKVAPKGITVVPSKPMKRPKPKKLEMPVSEPLFKPGGPKWKPLIPSGPKAPPTGMVGADVDDPNTEIPARLRLSKKELDRYREILMQKRAELAGDISNIEDEALRQNSGSLSSLPQHMAEQGSDTFEQSISLDLAQVDRNLIREIDEALKRIDEGTYGVCPRTGQRISPERLAELPWAKYSIEAQREMERRPYHRRGE
ncbi:MAG: TraR/DksA family transcriptional regulator [Phycisphaerales bacterium]